MRGLFRKARQGKNKQQRYAHGPLLFTTWPARASLSVPYIPVSHPFIERLIGTIRREYLDRVFFWNAVDLSRKLEPFRD